MKKLYPIAVEADVKQAIGARGHAGESYNKVLRRLLNLEENKKESLPASVGPLGDAARVAATREGSATT